MSWRTARRVQKVIARMTKTNEKRNLLRSVRRAEAVRARSWRGSTRPAKAWRRAVAFSTKTLFSLGSAAIGSVSLACEKEGLVGKG